MIECSLSALDVTAELLWVKFGGGLTGMVKWDEQQGCMKGFGASEVSPQGGKKNEIGRKGVTLRCYNTRYLVCVNITGKKEIIKQP